MSFKKLILALLLICCQKQSVIELNGDQISSLREHIYVSVKDSAGKKIGAGSDIKANPINIYFDFFKFYPAQNEIEVKGGVCSILTKTDTILVRSFSVIKAVNINNTLTAIEKVTNVSNAPLKKGQFYFKCKIDPAEKLYIFGGYTRVIEFNLQKILEFK